MGLISVQLHPLKSTNLPALGVIEVYKVLKTLSFKPKTNQQYQGYNEFICILFLAINTWFLTCTCKLESAQRLVCAQHAFIACQSCRDDVIV